VSIVSAFAAHAVGANAKATQTSGMKACRETVAGIKGVKELSGSSSPAILGGAQFDTSFSQKPAAEGLQGQLRCGGARLRDRHARGGAVQCAVRILRRHADWRSAQCAVILVASPQLFVPDCSTPRQMKLANALCRYREMAAVVGG
jgi:hypothetical protein